MLRIALATSLSLSSVLFVSDVMAAERVINVVVSVDGKAKPDPPFTGTRPAVDVAILLDTSNSMDGLISQAKNQLWTIVQQFADAKKNGQTPILRVALFEYGNSNLPATEGYIRQVVQLTDDLDALSAALFALRTRGGDEYCGQVIDEAVTRLAWSSEPNSYKAIFIAGNEPFTQGPVDYHSSCKRAIEKGIVVNTIHCGSYQAGVTGQWQDGAKLAEGEYFNINQDRAVVHIDCPQDTIIIQLNAELNKTYLWYGKKEARRRYAENQLAQDSNAAESSTGALVGRAIAKAGSAYRNARRDLVDTLAEDANALDKIQEAELPGVLKKMPLSGRKAHVERLAETRQLLQQRIATLKQQRDAYLAKQRPVEADNQGEATLGDAVVVAIQKQLRKSGFETK